MADQTDEESSDTTEEYYLGHVRWEMSADDLVHLQSQPFKKTFETLCGTSPSEWRFEMSLPEVRDDDTCSLSIVLERTDSLDLDLKACVWIDFCDPNDFLIFREQTFMMNGMLSGHVLQGTVQMIPLPNMRDAIHRNLKVYVTLMISVSDSDHESY